MNTLLVLMFAAATQNQGLPPGLLSSLCYVESHHNVNAIHLDDGRTNSVGVCQLKLRTARDYGFRGTETELLNPNTNIRYASLYLNHQRRRYSGDPRKFIAAYNSGTWHELGGKTRNAHYVSKVLKAWSENR